MFEVPVLAEQELVEQEVLLPECVGRLVRFGRQRFAVPSVLWPPLGDV